MAAGAPGAVAPPVLPLLLLAACLAPEPCGAAWSGRFLSGALRGMRRIIKKVTHTDVEDNLEAALKATVGTGSLHTEDASHLSAIEASIRHAYDSLPKTSQGRLAPHGVRHVVHSYFSKTHGWRLKGLEASEFAPNMGDVSEAGILKDKAPVLVRALLDAGQSGFGVSLSEVVSTISALERLIFDESASILGIAYDLNQLSELESHGELEIHEVLRSMLLIFADGGLDEPMNHVTHMNYKADASDHLAGWDAMVDFEHDALRNYMFATRDLTNPFFPHQFSFRMVSTIVREMAQGYGKWQNLECIQMKDALMALEGVQVLGRVPISSFYSQEDGGSYQFSEPMDYLREVGALDESVPGSPRVLVPNYLVGPSNCVAPSRYYSVCCLNECEGLVNELMGQIRSPAVAPKVLLGLVGNLSSSTVDAPRQLPLSLVEKLLDVAEVDNGKVQLHGRLFSQWLHYAFPNECPFPQVPKTSHHIDSLRSPWLTATSQERKEIIKMTQNKETVRESEIPQWSDDEMLPLEETEGSISFGTVVAIRILMLVFAVLAMFRMLWASFRTATHILCFRPNAQDILGQTKQHGNGELYEI